MTRTATRAFAERSDAERARLTYGYVTWLVERRHALSESDIARKLGGLLAEETKHLADVEALLLAADPEFSARSTKFMVVEAKLYQIFVDALACQLAHYPATGTGVTR